MKASYFKYLLIALATILIFSCGSDTVEIASVGDLTITNSDLTDILKSRYPKEKDFKNIDIQKKKDLLDQLVNKKLKVQAALELGMESDEDVLMAVEKQEENLLGQKYFESVVVDKLISAEEIEEYLEKQGVELKVTYILVGHEKANVAKKRSHEEAKSIAEKIVSEARQGKEFKELALKYSDDPGVKSNNGDLGYFKWGQKPKPFQQASWDMKVGEISDPVETRYGFNIIRLDDRKEVENYKPNRNHEAIFRIKQTLYSGVADSGKKLWEKTYENLKKEKSYKYHDEAIKEVAHLIQKTLKVQNVDMNSFTEEEQNIVLAEWDGYKITLNIILKRYEGNLPRVLGALTKITNMEKEVKNLSMIKMAVMEAKSMNLHEEENVAKVLKNFTEDRLANLVEKREVNEKVEFTDEEVKKYYDENNDQFMKPAQLEMWDILVETEKEAGQIADWARRGKNFENMAKKYSTDKYYKEKGGYQGFRTIQARSSISRKAFELGPNGKISDPIKYKKKWAVVKTGELRDKKIRPYNEVKKMAEGRLRNSKTAEMRKEWKAKLDETYAVEINEEALANI